MERPRRDPFWRASSDPFVQLYGQPTTIMEWSPVAPEVARYLELEGIAYAACVPPRRAARVRDWCRAVASALAATAMLLMRGVAALRWLRERG